MKKIRTILPAALISFALGVHTPTQAQDSNRPDTENRASRDDDNQNTGKWGLAGLLGLLGLLGLKKNDTHVDIKKRP